jgi:uncharacterized protein YggE
MSLILILLLIGQTGAGTYAQMPDISIDKPVLSVTGMGSVPTAVKATQYKIILYADTYAEKQEEASGTAESMRNSIIKATKELGGTEKDVTLTNLNTLEPVEGDLYHRVEQDIQILLKMVKDIGKVKEKFLLIKDVQIGSVTPIVGEEADYSPAVKKARIKAIKNAKQEAQDLASEVGVLLGEPIYISETIIYPTFTGYETAEEAQVSVSVTMYYVMIYKK